jgi:hypothetical protein
VCSEIWRDIFCDDFFLRLFLFAQNLLQLASDFSFSIRIVRLSRARPDFRPLLYVSATSSHRNFRAARAWLCGASVDDLCSLSVALTVPCFVLRIPERFKIPPPDDQ